MELVDRLVRAVIPLRFVSTLWRKSALQLCNRRMGHARPFIAFVNFSGAAKR